MGSRPLAAHEWVGNRQGSNGDKSCKHIRRNDMTASHWGSMLFL